MQKKLVRIIIVTGILSLAIGFVLGMGIGQKDLLGTTSAMTPQMDDIPDVNQAELLAALSGIEAELESISTRMNQYNQMLKDARAFRGEIQDMQSENMEISYEMFDVFFSAYEREAAGVQGQALTQEQLDKNIEMLNSFITTIEDMRDMETSSLQNLNEKISQAIASLPNHSVLNTDNP